MCDLTMTPHRTGSPAHAGIDRMHWRTGRRWNWFPRTRGDRPMIRLLKAAGVLVPPHTRG